MRKLLAFIIALSLAICAPAALAAEMSLEEITLKVKEMFEIGDEFTAFSSDFYDECWSLNWSSDTEYISVSCDTSGNVYSYWHNGGSSHYTSDFSAHFPIYSADDVLSAVNGFFGKVITDGSGWVLDDYTETLNDSYYISVSGRLTVNDHPTDIYVSASLDPETLKVESFYRGDQYTKYRNEPAEVELSMSDEEARAKLDSTNEFVLKYIVINANDMAKLCYVVNSNSTYIVRASDGEVIDAFALYNKNDAAASMMSEGDAGDYTTRDALSEAEIAGISVYDDALPIETLDANLRAMTELNIGEDYELTSAQYYGSSEALTASLTFAKKAAAKDVVRLLNCTEAEAEAMLGDENYYFVKYASLDAKTGALKTYSYSLPYFSDKTAREAAPGAESGAAEAFAEKYFPEMYAQTVLTAFDTDSGYRPTEYSRFTRVYDGYCFDDNYIYISIDPATGDIMNINVEWNDAQEFESCDSETIVSLETAAKTYNDTLEMELAYVSIPAEYGYSGDIYEYVLAWHYKSTGSAYAVDAATGEVLNYSYDADELYYGDIEGDANEEAILTLAKFGVGFSGGAFSPDSPMTYGDAMSVILQAGGQNVRAWSYADMMSSINYYGVDLGSITDADAQIDRIGFIKMLLDASGYGDAAAIPGIFACDFTDEESVAESDRGYLAIAYGLGIITAEDTVGNGTYAPLTRSEGARMLYNFLNR